MRHLVTFAAALVATASACTVPAESPHEPQPPVSTPSRKPERVAAPEPAAAVTGEVPQEIIAKLRADLAKQPGVDASQARVVTAQAVTWPNGALGCAQPGEIYTQALVPGYRVEFEAGGRIYAYHAAERGYFKLCPRPG